MFGLSKFSLSPYGMQRWFQANADGGEGSGQQETEDDSGSGGAKKNGKPAEAKFTAEQQEVINRLVGEARTKERDKARAEAEAETAKTKKKAEEEALAKNQEWEQLAATRAEEVAAVAKERDELLPYKEQAERYRAALEKLVNETMKGVPKHLLPLMEKMDPVETLEYLTKHGKDLNVRFAAPETPEEKEKKTLSSEDEASGRRAISRVHSSSF